MRILFESRKMLDAERFAARNALPHLAVRKIVRICVDRKQKKEVARTFYAVTEKKQP